MACYNYLNLIPFNIWLSQTSDCVVLKNRIFFLQVIHLTFDTQNSHFLIISSFGEPRHLSKFEHSLGRFLTGLTPTICNTNGGQIRRSLGMFVSCALKVGRLISICFYNTPLCGECGSCCLIFFMSHRICPSSRALTEVSAATKRGTLYDSMQCLPCVELMVGTEQSDFQKMWNKVVHLASVWVFANRAFPYYYLSYSKRLESSIVLIWVCGGHIGCTATFAI